MKSLIQDNTRARLFVVVRPLLPRVATFSVCGEYAQPHEAREREREREREKAAGRVKDTNAATCPTQHCSCWCGCSPSTLPKHRVNLSLSLSLSHSMRKQGGEGVSGNGTLSVVVALDEEGSPHGGVPLWQRKLATEGQKGEKWMHCMCEQPPQQPNSN